MIPKIDDITGIPTFITSDFDEPILYTPARTEFSQPCSSLKIITAFTDCDMNLRIKIQKSSLLSKRFSNL